MVRLYQSKQFQSLGGIQFHYSSGVFCSFKHQWTNQRHKHDFYEICLAISGHGDFFHGGESHSLTTGSVFIANPDVIHEISSLESKNLELLFFTFSLTGDSNRDRFSPESRMLSSFIEHHLTCSHEHVHLLAYLPLVTLSGVSMQNTMRHHAVYGLLLEMIQSLIPILPQQDQVESPLLNIAHLQILKHIDQDISMENLAKACHCSERTLRREVTRITGDKLSHWVHRQRIHQAIQLLRMNFRVSEVARATGYQDSERFMA